jgi:hypothetical protein
LELGAQRALARHPQPVGHDHVGGAAAQRDLARLRARQFQGLDGQAGLLVEAVRADHVELPGDRTHFLDGQPHRAGQSMPWRKTRHDDDEHATDGRTARRAFDMA